MSAIETTLKKLKKRIRNDGWMADTKDVLKEDFESIAQREKPQIVELINRFQEGWQDTLHFQHYYTNPLIKAVKKEHPNWDMLKVMETVYELLNEEIWQEYHSKNKTYDIAKDLLKSNKRKKLRDVV